MKNSSIFAIIAILFLFGFLFASVYYSTSYTSVYPRQVNPAQVQVQPSIEAIVQYYGILKASISSENFSAALQAINLTGFISIPENIRFTFDRFNQLYSQAISELNQSKVYLQNAYSLYSSGRLSDSSSYLSLARIQLSLANITVQQLDQASVQISSSLAIPEPQLFQNTAALNQLIQKYLNEINSLQQSIARATNLTPTMITLNSSANYAVIGSKINFFGSLYANDSPLAGRNVTIFVNDERLVQAVTSQKGIYNITATIPYIYSKQVYVYASFLPAGNDSLIYSPSSAMLAIKLNYTVPDLKVYTGQLAFPGKELNISGTLSAQNALSGYTVMLYAFGNSVSVKTGNNGSFLASIIVPPSELLGEQLIMVTSLPNSTIASSSALLRVNVTQQDTTLNLHAPSFVISGLYYEFNGSAYSDGHPVSNATVELSSPQGSASAITDNNGSFTVMFRPSLLSGISYSDIAVSIFPYQPWISHLSEQSSIFVFNPVALLAPLLAGIVLYMSIRRKEDKAKAIASNAIHEVSVSKKEISKEKEKAGIVQIYMRAVNKMSQATGEKLEAYMTMSEFLARVRGARNYESFKELTEITESAVYGSLQVDEQRANMLLSVIESG